MGKVKPTRDMELGRHARKAIAAIRDRGHTVRHMENDQGNVCLIGAMHKVVAPMGKVKAAGLVHEFNVRFGHWMAQHHPESQGVVQLMRDFSVLGDVGGDPIPPATMWNDRILLNGEEACAWLGKFADDLDPQR